MSQKGKRIFAWVMAIMMALMFVIPSLSFSVNAEDDFSEEKNEIADLSDQYKQLEEQRKQIDAQISKAKTEKEKKLALKQQIDGQISTTSQQINVLSERITLLEDRVADKEKEMESKQREIDENFGLFQKRMRAMYMSGGNTSTLGMVLGAESYSQFLMRAEAVTRVAHHDQELLDMLTAQKKELEEIKTAIEADKSDLQGDKQQMDAKKQELNGQMAVAQKQIQDIAAMEQQFLANKAELQKQMKEVQAAIDRIYAEINKNSGNTTYIGGEMLWPVPRLSQVTSNFGYRFSGSDYHTGMDISGAGAYGQSIVAANTGTVAFVNTQVTPGYGYGKYMIVDHGGGVTTLYAHCSSIDASVGDVVARGEHIAKIGSTGWSTGPHLHFEVRINGKPQNPAGYLRG